MRTKKYIAVLIGVIFGIAGLEASAIDEAPKCGAKASAAVPLARQPRFLKQPSAESSTPKRGGFSVSPQDQAASLRGEGTKVVVTEKGFSIPDCTSEEERLHLEIDMGKVPKYILSLLADDLNKALETHKFKSVDVWITNATSQKFNVIVPMLIDKVASGKIKTFHYSADPASVHRAAAKKLIDRAVAAGDVDLVKQLEDRAGLLSVTLQAPAQEEPDKWTILSPRGDPSAPPIPGADSQLIGAESYQKLRAFILEAARDMDDMDDKSVTLSALAFGIVPQEIEEIKRFSRAIDTGQDASAVKWFQSVSEQASVGEIKAIDFSLSSLEDEEFLQIPLERWGRLSNLKALDLSMTRITAESASLIADLTRTLEGLRFIDISDTDLASTIFERGSLWECMQEKNSPQLIEKIIWLPLIDEERDIQEVPEEYRERVLASHRLYSEVILIFGHLQESKELRQELNGILEEKLSAKL